MTLNPVKHGGDKKVKQVVPKYLLDPDIAEKFKDKMIDRSLNRIYKNKIKALEKGVDASTLTDAWRGSNEYIKTRVLECIPSRDIRFDMSLAMDKDGGRGIPRGKTMEISGMTELMKSARLYQIYADLQNDSRGAIIHHYETESKFQPRYVSAGGADPNQIILSCPNFIEAVYDDMVEVMLDYIKERDKYIYAYIMKNEKKSLSSENIDQLMFLGSLSFPVLIFGYDSIGNHASMLQWKKTQGGIDTKTPGAHAAAHAEGFRKIKTLLGNTMAIFAYVNHTKAVLDIGGGGHGGGNKLTDTYGGYAVKLLSDVRIEHKSGTGNLKTSALSVTRHGEPVQIGKWLNVKFMKNSIIETSKSTIEHCLFSYKFGFNAGVSYLLALKEIGKIKGEVSLTPSKTTKVVMPNDSIIEVTFDQFHQILMKDKRLRDSFRKLITSNANKNAVLVREDV